MKPTRNIEKAITNQFRAAAGRALHDRMLAQVRQADAEFSEPAAALSLPVVRRMIMKNSIVKLGIAAAVLAVVGLGIAEFLGDGGTSGTLWAQAARNMETSRGVIFRARDTGSRDPNDAWPRGYEIRWRSPAVSRTDKYRDGQMYRTYYLDYDAKTAIALNHNPQHCYKEAISEETAQRLRAEGWTDPQGLINLCLSVDHHELGPKTIDGVLCEGIEATGPDGSTGRLWVGVETGYPVLAEIEGVNGRNVRFTTTMDQFRWNVDLAAEGVEPEIPADDDRL